MDERDKLAEQMIETLAGNWPWEYEQTEMALLLAHAEGWPLDDTVRGLDRIAAEFGDSADPAQIVRDAIATKRDEKSLRRTFLQPFDGPS